VSFVCSIFEAVLLSINNAHIELLKIDKPPLGKELERLKCNIGKPLTAILTLNTIAHTIGAAGAGAQAAKVFGSVYLGLFSAILTLLILIFSEIIPKTLGAIHWKKLTPVTTWSLKYLVIVLYPFIKMSELVTGSDTENNRLTGLSREEFSAMAELSNQDGQLLERESHFLKNLMSLNKCYVNDAMTPRTVIFSLSEDLLVQEFFHKYEQNAFTRIPVYDGDKENITGYVFRSDLLLAQARGNGKQSLANYKHKLPAILIKSPLSQALELILKQSSHMLLIVNEYGSIEGIVTMEDVMETMLGFEIVDEKDKTIDMQKEAKKKWHKRTNK
jgi:CBS domain containing-hemolysin-like protein